MSQIIRTITKLIYKLEYNGGYAVRNTFSQRANNRLKIEPTEKKFENTTCRKRQELAKNGAKGISRNLAYFYLFLHT